jgi:hypothetical protein
MLRLIVSANVVPSSLIFVTLTIEAIHSYDTSVITRATSRNVSPVKYELRFYIPEQSILHSHRREILKSYILLTGWTL